MAAAAALDTYRLPGSALRLWWRTLPMQGLFLLLYQALQLSYVFIHRQNIVTKGSMMWIVGGTALYAFDALFLFAMMRAAAAADGSVPPRYGADAARLWLRTLPIQALIVALWLLALQLALDPTVPRFPEVLRAGAAVSAGFLYVAIAVTAARGRDGWAFRGLWLLLAVFAGIAILELYVAAFLSDLAIAKLVAGLLQVTLPLALAGPALVRRIAPARAGRARRFMGRLWRLVLASVACKVLILSFIGGIGAGLAALGLQGNTQAQLVILGVGAYLHGLFMLVAALILVGGHRPRGKRPQNRSTHGLTDNSSDQAERGCSASAT